MGGGSSRFEDTDWENASGKLVSAEETVDGCPPTSKYKVYHIHKTAGVINQREYDVTDEESNLLYSTRAIEGRLAWFDVLGPGMPGLDQYLLRIQVDLSRRYWVIYRYGQPSYPGQFADMAATSFMRHSRGDDQPCLYKKACITVTWSRYHAIVNLYGPPPQEYMDGKIEEKNVPVKEDKDSQDDTPSWAVVNPEFLAKEVPKETPSVLSKIHNSPTLENSTIACNVTEESEKPVDQQRDEEVVDQETESKGKESVEGLNIGGNDTESSEKSAQCNDRPKLLDEEDSNQIDVKVPAEDEHPKEEMDGDVAVDGTADDKSESVVEDGSRPDVPLRDFNNKIEELPEHLRNPNLGPKEHRHKSHKHIKKFSKWVKQNTTETPPNPLEGYLELDKPILKCEEINSFLGQHQTMLVSDREAKRLEQEELQAAAESGSNAHSPDANCKHGSDNPGGSIPVPTPKASSQKTNERKQFPGMRKIGKWLKKVGETGSEWAASVEASFDKSAKRELDPSSQKDQRQPSVPAADEKIYLEDDSNDQIRSVSSHASLDGLSVSSSKSGKHEDLEPLVGFWNWDNTVRVHKMKMHVAQGSDLALHVVLAVVTNQLRYERNVVVTTV